MMKWIEARVDFTAVDGMLCTDLVADLFYDMGLHGVLLDEPMQPDDQRQTAAGSPASGRRAVIGFIPVTAGSRKRCEVLQRRLGQLEFATRLALREIDDQNWSRLWKTHFKPLEVCPGLVVKPSWEPYSAEAGEIVIEIDPGMAFGTGHHPTTLLCLRMIRTYLRSGDTLLDVGTGSGILAIAAAKSGSGSVFAVDSDETAIAAAVENRRRNRIASDKLFFVCGSLTEPLRGRFHTVVANILPAEILTLFGQLDSMLHPGGIFIASGIPEQKADAIIGKASSPSAETVAVHYLDGWSAFAVRRSQ